MCIVDPLSLRMLQELGVKQLSQPELLQRYVLPGFHTLSPVQKADLITSIRVRTCVYFGVCPRSGCVCIPW